MSNCFILIKNMADIVLNKLFLRSLNGWLPFQLCSLWPLLLPGSSIRKGLLASSSCAYHTGLAIWSLRSTELSKSICPNCRTHWRAVIVGLCWVIILPGDMTKCLFTLAKELAVARNNNTTKEWPGEPLSSLIILAGVWVRVYLKKPGQLTGSCITVHLLQCGWELM